MSKSVLLVSLLLASIYPIQASDTQKVLRVGRFVRAAFDKAEVEEGAGRRPNVLFKTEGTFIQLAQHTTVDGDAIGTLNIHGTLRNASSTGKNVLFAYTSPSIAGKNDVHPWSLYPRPLAVAKQLFYRLAPGEDRKVCLVGRGVLPIKLADLLKRDRAAEVNIWVAIRSAIPEFSFKLSRVLIRK